jgi:hypothetical protein
MLKQHCSLDWCAAHRKALEKLQEEAVEAQQELEEAAEKEQEAAAALDENEKKLQKLRAEQERLKEVEEKDAQEAQASSLHVPDALVHPLVKTGQNKQCASPMPMLSG